MSTADINGLLLIGWRRLPCNAWMARLMMVSERFLNLRIYIIWLVHRSKMSSYIVLLCTVISCCHWKVQYSFFLLLIHNYIMFLWTRFVRKCLVSDFNTVIWVTKRIITSHYIPLIISCAWRQKTTNYVFSLLTLYGRNCDGQYTATKKIPQT